MTPQVFNIRERNVPNDAVYIGRGTKWGNPFVIGRDGNREEVIRKYADYLLSRKKLLDHLDELRGKHLVCHCAPLPCHGHLLLQMANTNDNDNFEDLLG